MKAFWLLILILFPIWGFPADREPPVEHLPDGVHPPGLHPQEAAVPEGMNLVLIAIRRNNFNNPNASVRIKLEVQIRGVWQLEKEWPPTVGGERLKPDGTTQMESWIIRSLPTGTTHVRVTFDQRGQAARYSAYFEFRKLAL
jgi:hypothetical protein